MTMWIILIGIPIILGLIAQARVSSTFHHWKNVQLKSGMTGAEVAQTILQRANIHDVEVIEIQDMLGDHYDPKHKRLCLSPDVFRKASVASAGIAAHEVGHAIQDAKGFGPLKLRMALVPITTYASQLLWPVIIASIFFQISGLLTIAIICFLALTIFQLVTLPVEYDASARAKIILAQLNIVQGDESIGINKVLNAAALTYVAAFVASLANLIYFILLRRE